MKIYPSNLPCPTLRNSDISTSKTFNRSGFSYNNEQKRALRSPYILQFSIVIETEQLSDFRSWYFEELKGISKFTADWSIESDNTEKIFGFLGSYTTKPLGNDKHEISAKIELFSKI